MSISRYYTVGAVAQDLRSLRALDERLEDTEVPADSLLVLSRRKDERLVGVILPGVSTRTVEGGLSRTQWFEFVSTYLGVTAVSVLMGAVHPPTGFALALATVPADSFDETQNAFEVSGLESPLAVDRRPVL